MKTNTSHSTSILVLPLILVWLAAAQPVSAEWAWRVVDGLSEYDGGVSPSVGLTELGEITVAYYPGSGLRYARLVDPNAPDPNLAWHVETVDAVPQNGGNPSLA